MPVYEYKAYAPGGATRTGVIDADTPREARQRLRRENLHVSDLKPVRRRGRVAEAKPAKPGKSDRFFKPGKPAKDGQGGAA
ncbi:MAG TPA: hypothetical protein VJP77_06430, partial [Planctomycetota bacterium]|nr:hypothetical protein [Planctomycetota bacterium]